jgi:hypothetical protein
MPASVTAIRELLRERNFHLVKVSRDVNMVSHELTRLGRVDRRTELWLLDSPKEIARAIAVDCNPFVPYYISLFLQKKKKEIHSSSG